MKPSGKEVLIELVELERGYGDGLGVASTTIGENLCGRDGRSVASRLRRLEDAGLILRRAAGSSIWKSTKRGRELTDLLIAADATRGGKFRPYGQFTTLTEQLALSDR